MGADYLTGFDGMKADMEAGIGACFEAGYRVNCNVLKANG